MFKPIYTVDPDAPYGHREQQLRAKYELDHGFAYAYVEYNGVRLTESAIGFDDHVGEEENLAEAKEYAEAFNRVWVMVEQTVGVL
jgi:fructose/tagatose bisphosphate aldolase